MSHNDTIVAQATPPGRGGVGILRISGLKALTSRAGRCWASYRSRAMPTYLPFNDLTVPRWIRGLRCGSRAELLYRGKMW